MAAITMKNIVKRYDDGFLAVNDVSLEVADGEFVILVGPSGCGKSTLLRMIVGLEDITSGDMLIGGKRVNEKAPRDRNLAMVFQNYALYPHLTVFENIAFPLRLKKCPRTQVQTQVHEAADLLELTEHLRPQAGEPLRRAAPACRDGPGDRAQGRRVPVRRAAVEPRREAARRRCAPRSPGMQQRLGTTTVYVTHDQTEAMTLGDRIAVLRKGLLQQVGSPHELYEEPATCSWPGSSGPRR